MSLFQIYNTHTHTHTHIYIAEYTKYRIMPLILKTSIRNLFCIYRRANYDFTIKRTF